MEEERHEIFDFNFFFGGRAKFTVESGASGQHYTYKITKAREADRYFVSLLVGRNNERDYIYLGLADRNKFLVLTANSRMKDDSKPVRVFRWALKCVKNAKALPAGYSIMHEGHCCRCGRILTDPESIRLGIGPECYKKCSSSRSGKYYQQTSLFNSI